MARIGVITQAPLCMFKSSCGQVRESMGIYRQPEKYKGWESLDDSPLILTKRRAPSGARAPGHPLMGSALRSPVSFKLARIPMPTAVTVKPGSLSAKRAAEYLDVAEQTLAKWRCHGEGPLSSRSIPRSCTGLNRWRSISGITSSPLPVEVRDDPRLPRAGSRRSGPVDLRVGRHQLDRH